MPKYSKWSDYDAILALVDIAASIREKIDKTGIDREVAALEMDPIRIRDIEARVAIPMREFLEIWDAKFSKRAK